MKEGNALTFDSNNINNEGDIIVIKKIMEVNVLINSIEQSLILIVLRNNNDIVTIII